jgi:hypothetical protein
MLVRDGGVASLSRANVSTPGEERAQTHTVGRPHQDNRKGLVRSCGKSKQR